MGAAPSVEARRLALPVGFASLLIALVGLAAAVYLTVDHYTASTVLACPENSVINCAKVTSSSYSKIGPVPVALLGALYFAAILALCTPAAWRRPQLDRVRIAGAAVGVASSLYLVWAEMFRLDAICLWCTVVHVSTLALLGAVLWTATGRTPA
jgi:uncharacterized membrane protein